MFILLLILIFIRPFISSLAFPYLNFIYSYLLMGFLVIVSIIKGTSFKKIQHLKYPLILFCLALLISIVFSVNKFNSLKEIYKYIGGILIFLIFASLINEDKIKIIYAIILAGFIISLLAIYQYFFGFKHLMDYISKQGFTDYFILDYISRRRVYFPFVTPNTLAGYLILITPLCLIIKNKVKWFILMPVSFALLLTKSLGALLSIFLALTLYFYLQDKLKKRNVLFLLGLLVIMGLVFMARLNTQKQHLLPSFSTEMRLNYWMETLKIIKLAPLTGVGIGNFNLVPSRYAHNSYLQIWAEMGILGIISILWLIISLFKSSLKNIKDSLNKNQIACLIVASIAFLIHNLIDFSFFLPEVSLIWWLILGLLVGYLY